MKPISSNLPENKQKSLLGRMPLWTKLLAGSVSLCLVALILKRATVAFEMMADEIGYTLLEDQYGNQSEWRLIDAEEGKITKKTGPQTITTLQIEIDMSDGTGSVQGEQTDFEFSRITFDLKENTMTMELKDYPEFYQLFGDTKTVIQTLDSPDIEFMDQGTYIQWIEAAQALRLLSSEADEIIIRKSDQRIDSNNITI